jgi:uncharacterized protein (TIGR03437 family)
LTCTATTDTVSTQPRAEAVADYIYDVLIGCTGGTPPTSGLAPTTNLSLTLSVAATSRIVATGTPPITEALLYLNGPPPGSQFPCTTTPTCPFFIGGTLGPSSVDNKNVYQGVLTSANTITFLGVPVIPPGSGTFQYRIANIRAAMFQAAPSVNVNAFFSTTGTPLTISPSILAVATVSQSVFFSVRNPADGVTGVPPSFPNTTPQNPTVGAATTPSFLVKFAQNTIQRLTHRNSAVSLANPNPSTLDPQTLLGVRSTETGYYEPAFPSINGLPLAGLPTQGSRMSVKFNGVPAGVAIYVGTQPGAVGSTGGTAVRLINESTGALVPPTVTIAGGLPMALLTVTSGMATATWEVLQPFAPDETGASAFPVVVSYSAVVPPGTVTVDDALSPIDSGTPAASTTLPVPRFRPGGTSTAFTITGTASLPSISTVSVPPGQEAVPHPTFTFTGTGGTLPYTWSITGGALPAGLALSAAGSLTGTPTTPGTSTFTVRLTDALGQFDARTFTMDIRPRVAITTTSLPGGVVGSAYGFTLLATGGLLPYTWSVIGGALPGGLALSAAGVLSGTPTAAATFGFTAEVKDSFNQTASAILSITIAAPPPPPPPVVTPLVISRVFAFPDGEVGRTYGPATVPVSGGTPPYTVTLVGGLPTGLLFANGTITGVPRTTGVFGFTLRASDAGGQTAQADYSIIVTGGLSIPTISLPSITPGEPVSATLPTGGGCPPFRWSATGLPPGITLSSSGQLTGQANADGTYLVDITLTDCSGAVARALVSLVVAPTLEIVSPSSIPDVVVGQPIPAAIAASGGAPPYSFSVRGMLPQGVQVDGQGLLTGRANAPGTFNITAQATDSRRQVADRPYSFRVLPTRIADCAISFQPTFLKFTLRQGATETKPVEVAALCGEPVSLTATVELPQGRSWLTTGGGVTVGPGTRALLNATAAAGALPVGTYVGTIRMAGLVSGSITVVMVVAPQVSSLDVAPNGLTFTAVENGPAPPGQTVNIVSLPSGPTAWSALATTTSGGAWLSINVGGGATDAGSPGVSSLVARVSSAGLRAGEYYGLIEVSSPGSSNGSKAVTVVLVVLPANQPLTPQPDTSGLVFTDGNQKSITLSNWSNATLGFSTSRHFLDAPPWFTVETSANSIAPGTQVQIRILPRIAGLPPGVRRAYLVIRYSDGSSTRIDLVLVIPRVVAAAVNKDGVRSLAGCTPARLTGVFTGLQQNFAVPVGWPSGLDMRIVDDCGDPLNAGSAIVGFSCCDGPKALTPVRQGRWTGTWVSRAAQNSEIQITADFADTPQAVKGTTSISGNVARAGNPPIISDSGPVNAAGLELYQPLAPGTQMAVSGSRLADAPQSALGLPLATSLGASSVSLGGRLLPLFAVGDAQVTALAPFDIPRNTELSMIARRGAALSVPAVVTIAPTAAGVYSDPQGAAAVLDAQGRVVNSANPAQRGSTVAVFASGLGAVDREVAPGAAAPAAEPFARTVEPVEITVGGARALVLYSGLAPGLAGVYQVNLLLPTDAPTGDAVVLALRVGESVTTITIPLR